VAPESNFRPLSDSLREAQNGQGIPDDELGPLLEVLFSRQRDAQTALHFRTAAQVLGPGHLIGFDVRARKVTIQLLGEPDARTYSFEEIAEFYEASYSDPTNVGQLLLGAYWESRIARRYLERIVANSYARIAPEEVDAFGRIVEVDEREVADLCPLALPEAEVKKQLCGIIGNPFSQKDWGGEVCDIFCNIGFRRRAVPAAFLLKGRSYAKRPLRIADLGKNGDQLIRMFSLPAELFVVQSNGPVDGAIYNHIQAQVAEKLMTNQPVYYLVLDGVQTARLLRAYDCI
jgi:hypothetical protein